MKHLFLAVTLVITPAAAFAQAGTGFQGKTGGPDNPGDRFQTNPGAAAPCGKGPAADRGLGDNTKKSSTNNPGGNIRGKDC